MPQKWQATLIVNNGVMKAGPPAAPDKRELLRGTSRETLKILPGLLAVCANIAPPTGILHRRRNTPRLDKKYCPGFHRTRVRVVDADTVDTATQMSPCQNKKPVCILNMANAERAGGGWLHGATAQEEAICYRSSLFETLKKDHYPLPTYGGIYSPTVLIIRQSFASGNGLYNLTKPFSLPVIACLSVAAINGPETKRDNKGILRYRSREDKNLMLEKMRVILRMAAVNGHRKIVLGAFGCGAFANPKHDVAEMWAEVLQETEFSPGWWEEVVFAVLDGGSGNKAVFESYLAHLKV